MGRWVVVVMVGGALLAYMVGGIDQGEVVAQGDPQGTITVQSAVIGTMRADMATSAAHCSAAYEAAWEWHEQYVRCAGGTPTPGAEALPMAP